MPAENVLWHLNLRSRRPENNLDGTRADRQGHARSRADTAATLRAEGHDVLEAGSADNGVRLAHEQGPEVILLDPMLPDRSGYELYASLQRDPATLAIPVLFLPGQLPPVPTADMAFPVVLPDIVTRLGLALRTKSLNDELRLADVSLRSAVLTDSLTGLANRVGDRLLQAFAGLLHESCRAGDTVARLEAEAFLLILPGTKLDAAWYVAERVRRRTVAIGAALGPDGPTLTASFGVAEHRIPDTWRDLLDRAEAALARAKRTGRNRCEVA